MLLTLRAHWWEKKHKPLLFSWSAFININTHLFNDLPSISACYAAENREWQLICVCWFDSLYFFHPLHTCWASKPGASLCALYISLVNLHTGIYRPHASMLHFIQTFTPKHLHSGLVWWNMNCNIWLGHTSGSFQSNIKLIYQETLVPYFEYE